MRNFIFSVFPSENFVDLCLYQFGLEQCAPAHSFGPAARNHYLFHYVISGSGTLKIHDEQGAEKDCEISAGQGFMIFPGEITTYIASPQTPWEYTWIEFDGLHAKESVEIAGLSPYNPVYHSHSDEIRENMVNEMLYIVHHKNETPLCLIGHLYLFLDSLMRSAAHMHRPTPNKLRDFYLKEAISFIEQNFQNNISVEDIAENCGLNRSYFGKIFKDSVGKSPQEFLIHYRMIKATELLRMTKKSVQEIGNAVGYPNALHFSRAFKNVYGLSPRSWRLREEMPPPDGPGHTM